jgi:hypothetical protein
MQLNYAAELKIEIENLGGPSSKMRVTILPRANK